MKKETKEKIIENWEKEFDEKWFCDDGWDFANYPEWAAEEIKNFIRKLLETKEKEILEENKKLKEALIWCSGSEDFNEGGKAREGWIKICQPLLKRLS